MVVMSAVNQPSSPISVDQLTVPKRRGLVLYSSLEWCPCDAPLSHKIIYVSSFASLFCEIIIIINYGEIRST